MITDWFLVRSHHEIVRNIVIIRGRQRDRAIINGNLLWIVYDTNVKVRFYCFLTYAT